MGDYISAVNLLAQLSGITDASIKNNPPAPGTSVNKEWSIEPEDFGKMDLTPIENTIGNDAKVTALNPGKYIVHTKCYSYDTKCTILSPGDLNNDYIASALDALEVLLISAGKKEADEEMETLGDYNGNGLVEAEDALEILKVSAGII